MTANHPVPVQVEHALATLAMLAARQELTSGGTLQVSQIDVQADEADTRATAAVRDTLRSQGWRAAAQAIGARSAAAGLPLAVTYAPVLMEPSALALRAPILRRVYNEMPEVRRAVDKAATVLSQGLTTVGGGSEQVASFARDMLDVGSTRTYLAHLARDAFVCGNGYLSFGAVADEDVRLLQPEQVTILGPHAVRVADGSTQAVHRHVMHMTGGEQQDSPYGLSILEPFVGLQLDREIYPGNDRHRRSLDPRPSPRRRPGTRAQQNVPLARRRLEYVAKQITETLGGTAHLRAEPPADLYFPGHELMSPAAARPVASGQRPGRRHRRREPELTAPRPACPPGRAQPGGLPCFRTRRQRAPPAATGPGGQPRQLGPPLSSRPRAAACWPAGPRPSS